jgi:hypothetical protein
VLREIEVSALAQAAGDRAERHVDDARVHRYMQVFDSLPPLVAFLTDEGMLLADGYHRLAAAVRLQLSTVTVDVREGTRRDALAFAVAQATRDRGVPPDQAQAAIERWSSPPRGPS